MPLDPIFFNWTTVLDDWFIGGVPAAVQGALSYVANPMRAAAGLYVIIVSVGLMFGNNTTRDVGWAMARAVCVAAIINSAIYSYYVQDMFLNRLPAEMAAALNGPTITASASQQFDVLRDGLNNYKAVILLRSPGPLGIFDRGMAHLICSVGEVGIGLMWIFWYIPRLFSGIVVVIGAFVVGTWLFDATRWIAVSWIGKLVTLLGITLASSVLVRLLLRVITQRSAIITAMDKNATVDLMMSNLAACSLLMWLGALMMLFLPAAITFGSGIGSAVSTGLGVAAGGITSASSFGGRALGAAGGAVGNLYSKSRG